MDIWKNWVEGALQFKKTYMSYQIAFGFGSQVFAGIEVFYVDPLVMAVPAIERYNAIAIPIH